MNLVKMDLAMGGLEYKYLAMDLIEKNVRS